MPAIPISLPAGSISQDLPGQNYGIQQFDSTIIDNLADGLTTDNMTYANLSGATNAKVIIILGQITPTLLPSTVSLTNGTDQYDMEVTTTSSYKRLEFNTIPTAFLSSFAITNSTGASFAPYGNSITIIPL